MQLTQIFSWGYREIGLQKQGGSFGKCDWEESTVMALVYGFVNAPPFEDREGWDTLS